MLSGLFRAICQVGIFMICAQTIVHFKPNGSYGKYLKMLVSVMLLIQIFLPIARIFSGDAGLNIEERVKYFEQNLEEVTKQAVNRAFQSEDMLERMTLEEVQNRLEETAEGEQAAEGEEAVAVEKAVVGGEQEEKEKGNRKVEKIRVKVGQTDEAE